MKNHPRSPGLLVLTALVCCAVAQGAAEAPPPGHAEALARLQQELPVWRARLPANRPRTFFTPEQWTALPRPWDGATAHDRRWLDAALTRAEEVATEPVPAYQPPEQFVAEGRASVFNSKQQLWQRPVGDQMVLLSFALAVRSEHRAFREALRSTVLTACAYPTWGTNLGAKQDQANVDLAAAHIARGIAIAYDWHPEIWSAEEKRLIRDTVRSRLTEMLNAAYAGIFWSHSYQANHNHVDVAALGLCGLAFLDEIPEAGEWLAHALNNFDRVALAANPDGSSFEGVPYWSYGLSFLLQFIEGTRTVTASAALYDEPFLRATANYRLASSAPGFGATMPWGDAPLRDYYGPHHILHRLAAQYRDPQAQFVAASLPFPPQGPGLYSGPSENRSNDIIAWTALWHDPSIKLVPPTMFDFHLPTGDLVSTRSGWSDHDYVLAIKSGFNNRNHGHLDAGALAFAFGDEWLLVTPGYGTGSANLDFWQSTGPRWNYLSNRTESHATLLIDGANQSFDPVTARGRVTRFVSMPDWCWTEVDLTAAYPGMTGVRRQVLHRRGEYALVLDRVEAAGAHQVEWLAQVPPEAQATGPTVDIAGTKGSLRITMLAPTTPFLVRTPTAPHIDVPPDRLRTWSVKAEGKKVEFAALLLPRFAGAPAPDIRATTAAPAEHRQTVIRGDGWTDTVLAGEATDELRAERCSALASTLVIRRGPDGVQSLLALASRRLQVPAFTVNAVTPTDLAVQRLNPDVWLVRSSHEEPVTLSEADGWTLAPRSTTAGFPAGVTAAVYRGDRTAMLRAVGAAEN